MEHIKITYEPYDVLTHTVLPRVVTVESKMIWTITKFQNDDHTYLAWIGVNGDLTSDYGVNWKVEIFGKEYTAIDADFIHAREAWEEYRAMMHALDKLD